MATIHITRGTTSLGTFSEEEVREGLRSGRFALTDLAWREGMATWETLSKWPEFGGAASPPPVASASAPAVAAPTASPSAPRSGLPWDRRQGLGLIKAFTDTLLMVLTKPAEAFTVMKREGGLIEPLIYLAIGGSFGAIVYFLFTFLLQSIGFMADSRNAMSGFMGMGIGFVFVIIFMPLFIGIGAFIGSAILHLCLMIVGGAKQSFETTFRVVCFAAGSTYPLLIVPLCGGMIAGIWAIVLYCIGLARAHETDTGRAVLAVFLPLIVCCGGGILLTFLLGGIGALSHWGH
jgi:hypothetical protein